MSDLHNLIEAEIPHLRRYARFLTHDVADADDLVQQCLVRAIERLHQWRVGTNMRAWLFTILRNQFISDVRRESRRRELEEEGDLGPPEPEAQAQEGALELEEVREAFETLGAAHREILVLIAIEGFQYEEAAVLLDVPVGTVRSRLFRARALLRQASHRPPKAEGVQ